MGKPLPFSGLSFPIAVLGYEEVDTDSVKPLVLPKWSLQVSAMEKVAVAMLASWGHAPSIPKSAV